MADDTGTPRKKGRTIMREFKINEFSAVDVPAQEGARAVIIKRYDPDDDVDHDQHQQQHEERTAMTDAIIAEALDAIRKAEGCTGTQAMQRFQQRHPDVVEKARRWQPPASDTPLSDMLHEQRRDRIAKAHTDLNEAMHELMRARGMSRTQALAHLRATKPSLVDRLNAA